MKYFFAIFVFLVSCTSRHSGIDTMGNENINSNIIISSALDNSLDGGADASSKQCQSDFYTCYSPCFTLEDFSVERKMCFDKCVKEYQSCVSCILNK